MFGLFVLACRAWVGWGAGGCGELARRGGGGGARGPSLYAQVDLEAIYGWKPHTVLT